MALDLTEYCGTVTIYASVDANSVTGTGVVNADGQFRKWVEVAGGSVHNLVFDPNSSTPWRADKLVLSFRSCYAEPETCAPPTVDVADPRIPDDLEALENREGNVEARKCPPEGDAGGALPTSGASVSLATGHKVEAVTDFTVKVSGPDFVFQREYTSDPRRLSQPSAAGNLLGRGWYSPVFQYMREVATPPSGSVLRLYGNTLDSFTQFNPTGTVGEWSAGGPTTQRVFRTVTQVDGVKWPVWRLIEPGEWTRDFYRPKDGAIDAADVRNPGTPLIGLILRESDPYGPDSEPRAQFKIFRNSRLFTYRRDTTGARLDAIYLNGSPGSGFFEARVRFVWDLASVSPTKGMLRSVIVDRGLASPRYDPTQAQAEIRGSIVTNRVDFTYANNAPNSPAVGTPTPLAIHPQVGSGPELIQVVNRERVMTAPPGVQPFWPRITQYRYHRSSPSSGVSFGTTGQDGQLKAVLFPQQIEFFAQRATQIAASPTFASDRAVEFHALLLLERSDDDLLNLPGASNSLKLRDLAGKIVGYYTAAGTNRGKVQYEYLLSSCGCGTSSSAQGLQQEFAYFNYTGGLTTRIAERKIENRDSAPPSTSLFRTLYHDMKRLGGVPYTVRRVVVEPGTNGRKWVTEYQHDPNARTVTEEATPSEFASYTPSDGTSVPSSTKRSNNVGLVRRFEYSPTNRLTRLSIRNAAGTWRPVEEYAYGVSGHPYLVSQRTRYRSETVTGGDADEVTTYVYGFFNSDIPGNIFWQQTSIELETSTENGPSQIVGFPSGPEARTTVFFDRNGRELYSLDADNKLFGKGYFEFWQNVPGRNPASYSVFGEPLFADRAVRYGGGQISGLVSVLGLPPQITWPSTIDRNLVATPTAQYESDVNPALRDRVVGFDLLGHPRITRTDADSSANTGANWGPRESYSSTTLAPLPNAPGILYRQEQSIQGVKLNSISQVISTSSPVRLFWVDASGEVLRSSEFAPDLTPDPITGSPASLPWPSLPVRASSAPNAEWSRSTQEIDLAGTLRAERHWSNVSAGTFEETSFSYDQLGRLVERRLPTGDLERTTLDVLGRSIKTEVGITGSLSVLSERFYDDPNQDGTPEQGVGNGVLSWELHYTGEPGDGSIRRTLHRYDHRDRRTGTVVEAQPIEVVAYDNLDRVVARGLFRPQGLVQPNTDMPASPTDPQWTVSRELYEEFVFSQRGLLVRERRATTPSTEPSTWLVTNRWYDRIGREVAVAAPGSSVIRTRYDALGRILRRYWTDSPPPPTYYIRETQFEVPSGAYSVDPVGGSNPLPAVRVLQQTEYVYTASAFGTCGNGDGAEMLRLSTTRLRRHDAPADGVAAELGDLRNSQQLATSPAQTVYYTYDRYNRPTGTFVLGGNSFSPIATPPQVDVGGWAPGGIPAITSPCFNDPTVILGQSGSTYTLDSNVVLGTRANLPAPAAFGNALFERTLWDERGRVSERRTLRNTLPLAANATLLFNSTRYFYDDLDRVVLEVSGDSAWVSTVTTTTRSISGGPSYRVPVSVGGPAQATATVYDAAGRRTHQIALSYSSSGEGTSQVTAYEYGVSTTAGPGGLASLVTSNSLLGRVRYPDPTSGLPGGSPSDTVTFAYNRLGEVREQRDQNQTVRLLTRDRAGRVTSDRVTSFGNANVDQFIAEHTFGFDSVGRLKTARARGASGTVRNAVEFAYSPLWQIQSVTQDIDSDFATSGTTNPLTVGMTYATVAADQPNGNYSRQETLVYPDGSILETQYSTPTNSAISRPSGLAFDIALPPGREPLVTYQYLGLGRVVQTAYPQVQVLLDLTWSANGRRRYAPAGLTQNPATVQGAGIYPGLDRFGRSRITPWTIGGRIVTDTSGNNPTLALVQYPTPIVAERFEYDAASRPTTRFNAIPGLGGVWDAPPAGPPNEPRNSFPNSWRLTHNEIDQLVRANRWNEEPGASISPPFASRQRTDSLSYGLDSLGNWQTLGTDLNGDNDFDDSGESSPRQHNPSNELTNSDTTSSPTLALEYDDNGNLMARRESATLRKLFRYDAWNRLVGVSQQEGSGSPTPCEIARYRHNALNWRVQKIARVHTAALPVIACASPWQRCDLYYSPSWQLIEERIDDGYPIAASETAPLAEDRRAQYVWGLRGPNDSVLRREDRTTPSPVVPLEGEEMPAPLAGSDGVYDHHWFYLTDAQFSVTGVVAMSQTPFSLRTLVNRTSYDPYGRSTFHAPGDANLDGLVVPADDLNIYFASRYGLGRRFTDANLDGVVSPDDFLAFQGMVFSVPITPPGLVSAPFLQNSQTVGSDLVPDSPVGYAGYLQDPETGLYLARHRLYDPGLGRWIQRDPAGYVDGLNLYQYVWSSPMMATDPLGLSSEALMNYFQLVERGNSSGAARIYAGNLTTFERSVVDRFLDNRLRAAQASEVFNTAAASVATTVRNTAFGVAGVTAAVVAAPVVIPAASLGTVGAVAAGVVTPIVAAGSYDSGQRLVELIAGRQVSGANLGSDLTAVERAERAGATLEAASILAGGAVFRYGGGRCPPSPKNRAQFELYKQSLFDQDPTAAGRFAPDGEPWTVLPGTQSPSSPANFMPPQNPPSMPPTKLPPGLTVRRMPPTVEYPHGYWKIDDAAGNSHNPKSLKPSGNHATDHVAFPPSP